MNKKIIEFDRTFFKTHKSRSTNFTQGKTSGFTLIELLVVISIIALLSTVVLSAVSDARVKARNTAKNSLVLEYVKALELYRHDNNGNYPQILSGVCVGYSDSENCFMGSPGSTSLKNNLSLYLPNDSASRQTITSSTLGDLTGVRYIFDTDLNVYILSWALEGTVSNCFDNTDQNDSFGGHTRCDFYLK